MKLVVAITGASGAIYGVRLLEVLRESHIETHLVVTEAASKILAHEVEGGVERTLALATHHYAPGDLEAPVASGSFKTGGMVVIPCSMRTLAAIAWGYASNLVTRAADVTLKEGRRLILVPRETPLNAIHFRNMLTLARAGVTVLPASPAFYHHPTSIMGLVDFVVGRVLDLYGIEHNLFERWGGKLTP